MQKTSWFVLTGGPASGKTKVLERLAFLGYLVRPEIARLCLDEALSRGQTIETIRKDDIGFQNKVFQMKLEVEHRTPKDQLVFWDRGLPDSIAYLKLCGGNPKEVSESCKNKLYRAIFLMEPLPYLTDYARTENSDQAKKIHEELIHCYTELGYELLYVPVLPISERAKWVLDKAQRIVS